MRRSSFSIISVKIQKSSALARGINRRGAKNAEKQAKHAFSASIASLRLTRRSGLIGSDCQFPVHCPWSLSLGASLRLGVWRLKLLRPFVPLLFILSVSAQEKTTYQDQILPLVEANCSKCHNA